MMSPVCFWSPILKLKSGDTAIIMLVVFTAGRSADALLVTLPDSCVSVTCQSTPRSLALCICFTLLSALEFATWLGLGIEPPIFGLIDDCSYQTFVVFQLLFSAFITCQAELSLTHILAFAFLSRIILVFLLFKCADICGCFHQLKPGIKIYCRKHQMQLFWLNKKGTFSSYKCHHIWI